MPYEFLEEEATADVAFEAWGKDLEETFRSSAEATLNVMVDNPEDVRPLEKRPLELTNEALDLLLFDFLQQLIYYKDAELLLLRVPEVQVEGRDGAWRLRAVAQGERLDPARHRQIVDVKAVTLHHFSLEQIPGGWRAHVILDI